MESKTIHAHNLAQYSLQLQEAFKEGYVLQIEKDIPSYPQEYGSFYGVVVWKEEAVTEQAQPVAKATRTKKETV